MNYLKHLNHNIESIPLYEHAKTIEEIACELGIKQELIIKMASNESCIGVSPKAIQAIHDAADEMFLYPDSSGFSLKKRIAEKFLLDPECIVLGCGSNEIVELIGHCFMGPQKTIMATKYTFILYKLICNMFGSDFIEVPMLLGFKYNLNAILELIDETTSVIFLCNPNNPTGTMVTEAEIDNFMRQVPKDVLVVFDEAYAEICLEDMPDTIKYVKKGFNCIVLRTFSKAYGLAGLRIGFGVGNPLIINELQKVRQPFNTTRMSQKAALAAIGDNEFIENCRNIYKEGKLFIEKECSKLKLTYIPTVTNFVLIKTGNSIELAKELEKQGIIVRVMGVYGLSDWIRVTISTMDKNKRFINVLKTLLL